MCSCTRSEELLWGASRCSGLPGTCMMLVGLSQSAHLWPHVLHACHLVQGHLDVQGLTAAPKENLNFSTDTWSPDCLPHCLHQFH